MNPAWKRCPEWDLKLAAGLQTELVGHPLVALDEVPSTNDVVKELALQGAPDGLAVVAAHQTTGRGRRGRTWVACPGKAVYLSVLLRPDWPVGDVTLLGVLGGVACADAAAELGVADLLIKWPNDVLARGRKLGGVLVEPRLGEEQIDFAVVGIGFNVSQQVEDWPEELRTTATSCLAEGCRVTSDEVIQALLRSLDRWYRPHAELRRPELLAAWSRWSGTEQLPQLD